MPHVFTKINSKWIYEVNVRAKTIKLSEEDTRVNLHSSGSGNAFSGMMLKAQATEEKINWTSSK